MRLNEALLVAQEAHLEFFKSEKNYRQETWVARGARDLTASFTVEIRLGGRLIYGKQDGYPCRKALKSRDWRV